MVHSRPALPQGHGEVLMHPAYAAWEGMLERNAAVSASWSFEVGGEPVSLFAARARREAVALAQDFSCRLGVNVAQPQHADPFRIVLTGHQPDLYHPGVWVKDFALQRVADQTGALAIDLVVDTDGFESVSLSVPCLSSGVERCTRHLAVGVKNGCYACSPVPPDRDIEEFCSDGDAMLATLPAPALRRHFADFAAALRSAAVDAKNLAELITIARRRYEDSAGTTYLELPVTALVGTGTFIGFVFDVAERAREFAGIYNEELGAYRTASGTRSKAQPFPDLSVSNDAVELPFWVLADGVRRTAWVRYDADGAVLAAGDTPVARISPRGDLPPGLVIAPKALTLTLYARMFLSDLFIHGVGGGRYDRVTDGVARRFYGVEAPGYVVASMTMYLPLGAHTPSEAEVAEARRRVNRLEHNPDSMLGEVEFDDVQERERSLSLANDKMALVARIAQPGADKKVLGARIREINTELSELLAPFAQELRRELESLEAQRSSADILTDRTYPFCLWSPAEVADKAR